MPDGEYTISQLSQDQLGNTLQSSIAVSLDNAAPSIIDLSIAENSALQGNIHLYLQIQDPTGVTSVKFAITQTDSSPEVTMPPPMTPATFEPNTQRWILQINTVQFKDGHYRLSIETQDSLGNQDTKSFEYTIRNWAIMDLSHFTENSKAGRTIPIKFNLHINSAADETQSPVYNEELEIRIFKTDIPSVIIQTFTFGPTSQDYHISEDTTQYICNFKTLKTPAEYTAQVIFNGLTIGAITFSTTK